MKAALTRESKARAASTPSPRRAGSKPATPKARAKPRATRAEASDRVVRQGPRPHDPRPGPDRVDTFPGTGPRLKHNPGSSAFRENRTYERHRGYYWKDARGRWRTPSGDVVPDQVRATVERRDGSQGDVWVSDKAWAYNKRRNLDLLARDTVNLLRKVGVRDVRLAEAREVVTERPQGVSPREAILSWATDEAAFQNRGRQWGSALAEARTGRKRWRLGGS